MTSKIDLDYIMSKRTLSCIETSLLEYKKKILEDLSNYIDVSYETLLICSCGSCAGSCFFDFLRFGDCRFRILCPLAEAFSRVLTLSLML